MIIDFMRLSDNTFAMVCEEFCEAGTARDILVKMQELEIPPKDIEVIFYNIGLDLATEPYRKIPSC